MRRAGIALMFALACGLARAAAAPCASLCGDWRLDPAASDAPATVLDAAFLEFKEPKARRPSRPMLDNLESLREAADEETLGPILDRPRSRELREELQALLQQPHQLAIGGTGENIAFAADGAAPRNITPGEESTRVDRYGSARIQARWRGALLAISEKYDRRNQQEITYTVGRDGALRVSQDIRRPGLPRVTLRSTYRRP